MNILIAGGTGLIGCALIKTLSDERHDVTVLSRNERAANEKLGSAVRMLPWDGGFVGAWASAINTADAVINLAGESIGERKWTKTRKEQILQSRVNATRAIVDAILKAEKKPSVLINASAVGFYGNVPAGDVDESHAPGNDFLAEVCKVWELEARRIENAGVRLVLLRTGIVLARNGGALEKMVTPFKFFIGGPLGMGAQWMPWIHLDDHAGIVKFALNNDRISGPINLSSPSPVMMKEFARALGRALHRPSFFGVPSFALKMLLGEMSSLVLEGQRAVPNKILSTGYQFQFPKLDGALRNIFMKK